MALHPQFIYLKDDGSENISVSEPKIIINTENYTRQDCMRYATHLYYEHDTPIDYSKIVRLALNDYLRERIGDKELKEIEDIKKAELKKLEDERKAKIPKFSWDLSKNKTKKEG